jgi:hypothetical protein
VLVVYRVTVGSHLDALPTTSHVLKPTGGECDNHLLVGMVCVVALQRAICILPFSKLFSVKVAFVLVVTGGEQWNNVYHLPSSQQSESLLLSQFPDFLERYLLAQQIPKPGQSANTMWEIESATGRKIAMVARALRAAILDTKHS